MPSVTLGAAIIGKEAALRESKNTNNGMGGGAIVLGPAFDLKESAEPDDPTETFTLLQAEQLLEQDPNAWVRVLKAEAARAQMRVGIAKAVLRFTADVELDEPMTEEVVSSLKKIAKVP